MNDFLDRESQELNLTEDVAELAATQLLKSLKESHEWRVVAGTDLHGQIYTAPELR